MIRQFHYFLRLSNIPLYVHVFIHLSVGGHLAIVNSVATDIGIQIICLSFHLSAFGDIFKSGITRLYTNIF